MMSTNNENYVNDVNGAIFTSGTSSGRGAPRDSQVVIQRNPYGVRVKQRGSGTVDLDGGWKLFYSGADPSMSAQAGVGILTSPRLSDCVSDWIPLGSRVCMLKLKVLDRSLCLLQVYAPNATSEYQTFVDEVNDALLRVSATESTVLMGDFNAHVGTDTDTWKGVNGKHGVTGLNENGRYLLQLCCSNGLRIMNTFFQHREVHKYTWYRPSMDQKSLIDFCIVSSDLFSDVLDVRVKRGAELSTDHHLVVCSLRLSKPWPNKRSNRSSVTYRIKWEALEDKEVRKQFASSISSTVSSDNFLMYPRTSRRNGCSSDQQCCMHLQSSDQQATIGNCKISRLLFADDLVLLSSTESGLQRALNSFADACNTAGMKISTAKTEVLHLSRNPDHLISAYYK